MSGVSPHFHKAGAAPEAYGATLKSYSSVTRLTGTKVFSEAGALSQPYDPAVDGLLARIAQEARRRFGDDLIGLSVSNANWARSGGLGARSAVRAETQVLRGSTIADSEVIVRLADGSRLTWRLVEPLDPEREAQAAAEANRQQRTAAVYGYDPDIGF